MSEFYAPWRISGPDRYGRYVVWDANSNPMAECEDDDYFMTEAVRRINVHDDLLAACEAAARWLDALNDPDERADDMTLAYLKLETERAVFPALRTAKKRG